MSESKLEAVVVGNISILEKPAGIGVAQATVRLVFEAVEPYQQGQAVELHLVIADVDAMTVRDLERAALEAAADLLSHSAGLGAAELIRRHEATRGDEISTMDL